MRKKDFPYLHMFIVCCGLTLFWAVVLWETEKSVRTPEALGALFSVWAFAAMFFALKLQVQQLSAQREELGIILWTRRKFRVEVA